MTPPFDALALFLIPLALVVYWLGQPWWRNRQRNRLMAQAFPASCRRILRQNFPLYARLPPPLQQRLKGLIQVFLAEKPMIGCQGLKVTHEMRITIAAQACMLLLGHPRGYYPELRQVLVYPGPFVVDRPEPVADLPYLQVQESRVLAGESSAAGLVMLSWSDAKAGAANEHDGWNVVIHEFAHQLDQAKGFANGAPLLPSRKAYERWSVTMQAEYDALHERLNRQEDGLINPYAATNPGEFFAVVSELFFECPLQLHEHHPRLYQELARYYQLDPRAWHA
jgi:Mlc titration factor MtfA (ptsG expression regulator)